MHQVVLLTQNIEDSFEAKKKAGAVFVDLAAAYDTVWHRGLTCKLLRLLPDKHMAQISVVQLYFTAGHQKLKIYYVGRRLNFRNAILSLDMSGIFGTHGNPIVITLITVIICGPKLARGPAVGPGWPRWSWNLFGTEASPRPLLTASQAGSDAWKMVSHRDQFWHLFFSTYTSTICLPQPPKSMPTLTTWRYSIHLEIGRCWKEL